MDRTTNRQRKHRGRVPRTSIPLAWALLVAIAVVAATFAPVWGFVVLAVGLVLAGVQAAITERVHEVFKRKPDLTLLASAGKNHSAVIEAPTLRPWPVDVDRIVALELESARATEQIGNGILDKFLGLGDPLAIKPSQSEKNRALEAFREEVDKFGVDVRAWLVRYVTAADEGSRTFELRFEVVSGPRGAPAENVALEIELPPGVDLVDEWPTVEPPPKRPRYSPPRPCSISDISRHPIIATPITPVVGPEVLSPLFGRLGQSIWKISTDERRIEASLGNVHHGRTRELGEALLVRTAGTGDYELRWTMFATNSRRHCKGTLTLVVPPTPARPAFGTMEAIRRFPDVPVVDGDVIVPARTDDPPIEPPGPAAGTGLDDRMAALSASRDWHGLGFGDESAAS